MINDLKLNFAELRPSKEFIIKEYSRHLSLKQSSNNDGFNLKEINSSINNQAIDELQTCLKLIEDSTEMLLLTVLLEAQKNQSYLKNC